MLALTNVNDKIRLLKNQVDLYIPGIAHAQTVLAYYIVSLILFVSSMIQEGVRRLYLNASGTSLNAVLFTPLSAVILRGSSYYYFQSSYSHSFDKRHR